MMLRTHHRIDAELCGRLVSLEPGSATVALLFTERMRADDSGLCHGGFTFGLADHAAMLAVNEPTVVLSAAEVKFLRPTVVGDEVVATAKVVGADPRKPEVEVRVLRGEELVFEGRFFCAVPKRHVLEPRDRPSL